MCALLTLSAGKARFLASPAEVLSLLHGRCDETALEGVLCSLAQDGYVDYIATERKGEKTYVVELRPKGRGYVRSAHADRRRLMLRFAVALVCGVVSALIGLAIKLLAG